MRWTRRQLLSGAAATAALHAIAVAAGPRLITDSAGRRVGVPSRIARVAVAGSPAAILVYALAPDRLLGWARALSAAERAFLPPRYAALPGRERLTGRGDSADVQAMAAARPDAIVDYGMIGPGRVAWADGVQRQTGVPYLLYDPALAAVPRVCAALGAALGVGDRGRELAGWADRVLREVDQRVAAVPKDRRPSVYYASGPRGLETRLRGSINVESLERIGARNVATGQPTPDGIVTVQLQQVRAWDPDVIVTVEPAFMDTVHQDPGWGAIRAVRSGRVYRAPLLPFPWIDGPPSINRLIGLTWLGQLFYPEAFAGNLREATRDFYVRFYHRAPGERQLDVLLAGARPSRGWPSRRD